MASDVEVFACYTQGEDDLRATFLGVVDVFFEKIRWIFEDLNGLVCFYASFCDAFVQKYWEMKLWKRLGLR